MCIDVTRHVLARRLIVACIFRYRFTLCIIFCFRINLNRGCRRRFGACLFIIHFVEKAFPFLGLAQSEIDLRIVKLCGVLNHLTITGSPFRCLSLQKRQLIQVVFVAEIVGKDRVVVVSTHARFCFCSVCFRQVQGFLCVRIRLWQVTLPAVYSRHFGNFLL